MKPYVKILLVMGCALIIVAILIQILPQNWFGRLPGDIRIEKEKFKFYFPVTTSILLSILISLIIFIISKLKL